MATNDNPDLTTETNDDLLSPDKLDAVAAALETIPDTDLSCHADEFLAEHTAALKRLENAAENARKNGYEDELDDRVKAGETVGPLRKQTGRNTWVSDTEGAFAAVADHGNDPLDVASVGIGDLRDVLGDRAAEEYIEASSYSYFVRR
jgi:hypothetical protein